MSNKALAEFLSVVAFMSAPGMDSDVYRSPGERKCSTIGKPGTSKHKKRARRPKKSWKK